MAELDDFEDARLSELLRAVPLPQTPASLAEKARRRKERPAQRRVMMASCLVVIALAGATMMMSNREGESVAEAPGLNTEDLAALFAPPPVDSLDLLDNRQAAALRALEQLGRTP